MRCRNCASFHFKKTLVCSFDDIEHSQKWLFRWRAIPALQCIVQSPPTRCSAVNWLGGENVDRDLITLIDFYRQVTGVEAEQAPLGM